MTVRIESSPPHNVSSWSPIVGAHTDAFLRLKSDGEALDPSAMKRVLDEASDILGHCRNPTETDGSQAVLVVGYVQSGKTLSFTTVAALARDNGFGVVIVLAGTTKNLKAQSEARLELDLGLSRLQSAWSLQKNPSIHDEANLRRIAGNWRRKQAGLALRDKPALLLTVLKNSTRIRNAAEVLRRLDLSGVPALVIDDESDQASLNTKARRNLMTRANESSETYDAIVNLRDALPHHSYLQYTATPQANLLLAISDVLNPDYAKVISSGPSYTGGRVFFDELKSSLIVPIPPSDVYDPKSPPIEAPESLQDALRVYLLGAACVAHERQPVNRSMMVQVSQATGPHAVYAEWIEDLLASWGALFRTSSSGVASQLRSDFSSAYARIQSTSPDIPPLDELMRMVGEICEEVRVIQVNSVGAEREVDWRSDQFWVLVGGQKLDRGFTVEGLTVTYMPRNISENADVLQQRARFFGYRRGYIGFCRVYMPKHSIGAFEGYVRDEEFLRTSLIAHSGQPLSAWRREFLLNRSIARLTRLHVSGRGLRRMRLDAGWAFPKSMHRPNEAVWANDSLMDQFIANIETSVGFRDAIDFPGIVDRRSASPANVVAERVPTDMVLDFLVGLDLRDVGDRAMITALTTSLGTPGAADKGVDVVLVSSGSTQGQTGRSLTSLRRNLFVGESPEGAKSIADLRYSGDRSLIVSQRPTLHLRRVSLRPAVDVSPEVSASVPWIAVHLTGAAASDALLEEF